jgi:opacity protein-like surface antigen
MKNLKNRVFAGAAIAIAAIAVFFASYSGARAQAFTVALWNTYSCSNPVYGTNSSYLNGSGLNTTRSVYTPECSPGHTSNAAGSVVTAIQTLRAASAQTANLVSARIANARNASNMKGPLTASLNENDGTIGLSGGDMTNNVGAWIQGSFTHFNNDASATEFDGNLYSGLVGLDKKFDGDRIIAGVSLGFEGMSVDTDFNNGHQDSTGFLVAPYGSFALNDMVSIDGLLGYGRVNYDLDRKDPATGELFSGDTDANRYFASIVANLDAQEGQWVYGGIFGLSYIYESRDSFTETGATGTTVPVGSQSSHVAQGLLGGNLGYDLGMVTPFANARLEYDFAKSNDPTVAANQTQPDDSNVGIRLGVGAEFEFAPNITGSIEGNGVLLRDDYSEYGGRIRLRIDF